MSNNEEFVIQDTKGIQIQSVCAFMEQFNYLLHVDGKFYSNTFWDWEKGKREDPYFKGCEVIRMSTAVTMHNSEWVVMGDISCPMVCTSNWKFMTYSYTLNKALAARIVKQVFLQGTKHGQILCHKHLIRFVDSSYQYLFLKDESLEGVM